MNNPYITRDTPDRAVDEWEGALCREVDPELFFPESGFTDLPAKNVCSGCDLKAKCLAVAVADPSLQGVWGGTSTNQRKAIRAQGQVA